MRKLLPGTAQKICFKPFKTGNHWIVAGVLAITVTTGLTMVDGGVQADVITESAASSVIIGSQPSSTRPSPVNENKSALIQPTSTDSIPAAKPAMVPESQPTGSEAQTSDSSVVVGTADPQRQSSSLTTTSAPITEGRSTEQIKQTVTEHNQAVAATHTGTMAVVTRNGTVIPVTNRSTGNGWPTGTVSSRTNGYKLVSRITRTWSSGDVSIVDIDTDTGEVTYYEIPVNENATAAVPVIFGEPVTAGKTTVTYVSGEPGSGATIVLTQKDPDGYLSKMTVTPNGQERFEQLPAAVTPKAIYINRATDAVSTTVADYYDHRHLVSTAEPTHQITPTTIVEQPTAITSPTNRVQPTSMTEIQPSSEQNAQITKLKPTGDSQLPTAITQQSNAIQAAHANQFATLSSQTMTTTTTGTAMTTVAQATGQPGRVTRSATPMSTSNQSQQLPQTQETAQTSAWWGLALLGSLLSMLMWKQRRR